MKNTYKVTRDNKTLFTGTENECFEWLLNHQSMSVDWAIKHEGYKIEKVKPSKNTLLARRFMAERIVSKAMNENPTIPEEAREQLVNEELEKLNNIK